MKSLFDIKNIVFNNEILIRDAGQFLWDNPETAYNEFQGSSMLSATYAANGFKVVRGAGGFPTSFIAEWKSGDSGPSIGLFSDFDALPGLSTVKKGAPGHGCNHNQYAARALGTAVSMKQIMEKFQLDGRIVVFGAPAEESGGSKQYFVRQGLMQGIDVFIGLHPVGHVSGVMFNKHLASAARQYIFTGQTAHAALAPDKGRNALSALEFFNTGVHFLRGQLPDGIRINHVITAGGVVSNMIPDNCAAEYSIRAGELPVLEDLVRKIDIIAKAAADALDCSVKTNDLGTLANSIPNYVFAKVAHQNAKIAGTAVYSDAEQDNAVEKGYPKGYITEISPLPETPSQIFGSTDEGDVSWTAPWVRISIPSSPQGVPAHTKDQVYFSGLACGYKGTMQTVLTACLTIYDLLTNPDLINEAKAEHDSFLQGKVYQSAASAYPDPALFPALPGCSVDENGRIHLNLDQWPIFSDLENVPIRVKIGTDILGESYLGSVRTIDIPVSQATNDKSAIYEIQFSDGAIWNTIGYVKKNAGN